MSFERSETRKSLSSKINGNIFNLFDSYCKEAGQSKRVALERILLNFLEDYYGQDEKERRPL